MEFKYKKYLNEKKFNLLVGLKDWKNPTKDLAEAIKFSESYCSRLIRGLESVREEVESAYIIVSGANPNNPVECASLFDYRKVIVTRKCSYQAQNHQKYKGLLDYAPYSWMGKLREADRMLEIGDKKVLHKNNSSKTLTQ